MQQLIASVSLSPKFALLLKFELAKLQVQENLKLVHYSEEQALNWCMKH